MIFWSHLTWNKRTWKSFPPDPGCTLCSAQERLVQEEAAQRRGPEQADEEEVEGERVEAPRPTNRPGLRGQKTKVGSGIPTTWPTDWKPAKIQV